MGESDRVPIGGLPCGCGDGDWGDGLWDSGPLGPDTGTPRERAGGASGWPVVGYGETSSRRRCPTGTPPGALGPMLSVWGHAGWKVFRKLVPGIAKGLWNTRRILSLGKPLGSGWALGGHPETSAHPHAE